MSRVWLVGAMIAGALPIWAAAPAIPGTINYIEGQVRLEGRSLSAKSAGSAAMEPNQILSTDHGKAEVLLTPGVFLRVGDNSSVRMVSPELANTSVELMSGEAMVEANEVLKGNNITVVDSGATTRLGKNGLYDFKTAPAEVAVYDGKASVMAGDQQVTVKKGKEVLLAGTMHAQSFDRKSGDALYAWSSLRSEYGSEASMAQARTLVVNGGWWGPGWYWNPWWDMYSFVPGGYLYSPFGWGFYGPGFIGYAPLYFGGRFHGGAHGHAFVGRPGVGAHAPVTGRAVAPGAGRVFGGGFHSGGFGGGFHGGGGFRGGGRGR